MTASIAILGIAAYIVFVLWIARRLSKPECRWIDDDE